MKKRWLIVLGVVNFAILVLLIFLVLDAKKLRNDFDYHVWEERTSNRLRDYQSHLRFEKMQKESDKKTIQISIIEESVDPKNFRWSKIKKVREAIKYHRFKDIKGLTIYAGAVVDFSEEYDVPISLILAVTRTESAFNPKAVSHAGAKGLIRIDAQHLGGAGKLFDVTT